MATALKAHKAEYLKPSKPKMMIFGVPDTDKSKFGCEWPSSVYMDTENGAVESQYVKSLNDSNSLYFGIKDGSQNLKEVIDQIKLLIVNPGDRQSLIIDSERPVLVIQEGRYPSDATACHALGSTGHECPADRPCQRQIRRRR